MAVELLLIVAGLILLGLAAARFGQDSREPEAGAPWHSWRDSRALASPLGVDPEMAFRLGELHATAARERLLRPVGTGPRAAWRLTAHRAVVAWLGASLVRVGERLQDYGRTAAPGW
jgi:hypothetical protein